MPVSPTNSALCVRSMMIQAKASKDVAAYF